MQTDRFPAKIVAIQRAYWNVNRGAFDQATVSASWEPIEVKSK